MKYFVLGLFFFGTAILICASIIIILRKEIFYTYIKKEKKISNFDYLMDFDGNWIFKDINLKEIPEIERNDKLLLEKLERILVFKRILYVLLFLTLIFLVLVKAMKIL